MAHSVESQRVTQGFGLGLGSRNASGDVEKNGAVAMLEIDLSNYPTNGETVQAHELGFSVLYNVIVQTNELDNDIHLRPVVAADGKSVVINAFEGTSEVTNATNLGQVTVLASGEPLGQE